VGWICFEKEAFFVRIFRVFDDFLMIFAVFEGFQSWKLFFWFFFLANCGI